MSHDGKREEVDPRDPSTTPCSKCRGLGYTINWVFHTETRTYVGGYEQATVKNTVPCTEDACVQKAAIEELNRQNNLSEPEGVREVDRTMRTPGGLVSDYEFRWKQGFGR